MYEATHRFEEHTSEVQVRVQAPDLAGLFREAGVALAELMAPGTTCPGTGESERVELQARDREALLVEWIDELIYRVDMSGKVYADLEVESIGNDSLRARVRGCTPAEFKTAVKAATFHQLAVQESAEGFTASLIVDV